MASPLCLAHAAATCKRWRRIMARPGFFADMIRGLHPRPFAGNYYNRASPLDIVFVPSPTSPPQPQQRAVGSHKFSLDFPPGGAGSWEVVDSSRSLVLLAKKKRSGWMRRCFPDLIACEPATRRYKLIPRVEEMKHHRCLGAYLVDTLRSAEHKPHGGLHVVDIMTNFRGVCVIYQEYDGVSDGIGCARAFFFSRNTRALRVPHTWFAEKSSSLGNDVVLHGPDSQHFLGYAGGSLLWSIRGDDTRLVTATGGTLSLPDNFQRTVLRVVDSARRRGYVMLVCLQGSNLQVFEALSYSNWNNQGEWELHKSLDLMEATRGLVGHKEEYFVGSLKLITASPKSIVLAPTVGTWMFSVDLHTITSGGR
ncbi:hypothetical protein ACQ4PT_017963 [Festuca glaucescens]